MNNIENLVFAGGGVKVISYAGAVKALEEKGVNTVKKVAGTSGGAIISLCLALDYKEDEIKEILNKTNFQNFSDRKMLLRKIYYYLWHYGLNSGDYFYVFLGKIIKNKGFNENITFRQLMEKHIGKELYVIVTNLSTQFVKVLSHKTVPDMPVIQAVRMSGSFPIYFTPVKYNKDIYVDGGIAYNYPIDMFDETKVKKFSTQISTSMEKKSGATLGCITIDSRLLDAYRNGREPKPFMPADSYTDLPLATADMLCNSSLFQAYQERNRTVFIDDMGISTLQFSLTDKDKNDLMKAGYDAMILFLSKRNDSCIESASHSVS